MPQELNYRQKKFIEEYAVDGNGARSVMAAGYGFTSPDAASLHAGRLLRNASIAGALKARHGKVLSKLGVTADRVIEELARIAFSNASDYMSWDDGGGVKLKASGDLTPGQMAAVSEVVTTTGKDSSSTRVKLHDKLNALGKLALHTGVLNRAGLEPDTILEDMSDPVAELEVRMKSIGERVMLERVTVTERVTLEKNRG